MSILRQTDDVTVVCFKHEVHRTGSSKNMILDLLLVVVTIGFLSNSPASCFRLHTKLQILFHFLTYFVISWRQKLHCLADSQLCHRAVTPVGIRYTDCVTLYTSLGIFWCSRWRCVHFVGGVVC